MIKESALRTQARNNLKNIKKLVDGRLDEGDVWFSETDLNDTFQKIENNFDVDMAQIQIGLPFLHNNTVNAVDITDGITAAIQNWQLQGKEPSLYALCVDTFENLNLTPSPDFYHMVMMAAFLGEMNNDQPYHDNTHFKKVLLHLICIIKAHNTIFLGGSKALKDDEICMLIAAACIHDIGHDGMGNIVKGVHIPHRLERRSFEYAKPFLALVGMNDEAVLNKLLVMLLTTDVSPLDDPANPMHQMKAAYRFHYLGEGKRAHSLHLADELDILEKDPRLATMCLLLHEADIATSAGLNYEVTKYETSLLREEFCGDQGKPSHIIDFLNQICSRRFLSDAGQKLYAANLARIYALAEEGVENGDEEFPVSEHADFILAQSSLQTSKTIN